MEPGGPVMPQLKLQFIAFVALITAAYWLIPANYRKWLLLIAGASFIITLDLISFLLLTILCVTVFFAAGREEKPITSFLVLAGLIAIFCLVRLAQILQRSETMLHIFLLLGFGFYMLKLVHYWVERRMGRFRTHTFVDFYNYMLFFPTMTIGPIIRFDDFFRSMKRNHWDGEMFAAGLERILYGYVKMLVLANWVVAVMFVNYAAKFYPGPSAFSTFLDSLIYGLHLYLTFAGASDIAIGVGALLGYRICENFDWPFIKKNIGEFWQSWHMSLSGWCRQYIFLPVFSASRNLPLAFLVTMVTLGLWHEFSMRYVLWGCYHGAGLTVWRWFQRDLRPSLPQISHPFVKATTTAFCIILTFVFVVIGFTIPRSESFSEMIRNFQLLVSL
jgi:alginate O-acetyltransferase complex protein AlgI